MVPEKWKTNEVSPVSPQLTASRWCSGHDCREGEARQFGRLLWLGVGNRAARVSKKRDTQERTLESCRGSPSRLIRSCWEKLLEARKEPPEKIREKNPLSSHLWSPLARLEKPIIHRAHSTVFRRTLSQ